MAEHESSVNYENLVRDLAEMYPFEVAEVVLVELVANSLDAGASLISIDFGSDERVLAVTDDGNGMNASDFDEYHDFAAGLKTRGTGIGFAGVGAKISFNIAHRVLTETRSGSFSGGSNWYLQSRKRLVWEDSVPTHLRGNGTRAEVYFRPDVDLPYSSSEDLVRLLRRHYLPLLDAEFLDLYGRMGVYSRDLRFAINGEIFEPGEVVKSLDLSHVRKFFPKARGKRVGYGVLGLAPSEYPLGPDCCGLLLCTRGKVIKADLFNQFPGNFGPRIIGLVEVPAMVGFLTTAKTDFARRLKPGEFERLYGPIREEFKAWLAELGIQPTEIAGTDEAARLERELRKVLEDIPELSEFSGFRSKKPVLEERGNGQTKAVVREGIDVTYAVGEGSSQRGEAPVDVGEHPGEALTEDPQQGTAQVSPITRTARRGPRIGFAEAPDRVDLAWVDGNSVIINSGHPSYARARPDSTARRHHCLFAIGSAIQRYLAPSDGATDLMFVDRMMAAWGKK